MAGRGRTQLIIFGAGPVGLVAAIRARQLGLEVEIRTDRLPTPDDPPWIEAVPAQMIALLIEFGVHPRELGVERLHEKRFTQWRSPEIVARDAPNSAHISRPALELALLNSADRAGVRIQAVARSAASTVGNFVDADVSVLDATGRSAATAAGRITRPKVPLVFRTFVQPVSDVPVVDGFAIAAGPDGYAYRLCNAQHSLLGIVGHGEMLQGSALAAFARIRDFAPWIVADLDPQRFQLSRTGAASLQWCGAEKLGARLIGDARVARDALASQGLAIGIGDALRAASEVAASQTIASSSVEAQLAEHRRQIIALIEESVFAASSVWRSYRDFLSC